MSPLAKYNQDVLRSDFVEDEAQKYAITLLDDLYFRLIQSVPCPSDSTSFFSRFFKRKKTAVCAPEKGVYFWGGVGRGKTYVMDTFFDCLPIEKKQRMHFHRFMQYVHEELNVLDKESDPLQRIADKLALRTSVICFDEFFVSDITDAMILGTLFEALFKRGVCLVATSNVEPNQLYRNGLQRARFLPAIALIEQHCDVVNLDSGVDYRLRTLTQAEIYHYPLNDAAEINLRSYFTKLTNHSIEDYPLAQTCYIRINQRDISIKQEKEGVLFVDFSSFCQTARSQFDYIEIAQIYHTVLLSGVTQMHAENDDVARRFIAMVDEFYERQVKLIISAEVSIDDLYSNGLLSFEFKRCRSRLKEMQSHEYLRLPHLL